MKIKLNPFQKSDLILLDAWCGKIESHKYMSHVTPYHYKKGDKVENRLWDWYTICVDHKPIGAIWLEKDKSDSDKVILGILLGSPDKFGQGIGSKAIQMAIEKSHKSLGFKTVSLTVRKNNKRAISCYQKCGFTIIGEDSKVKSHSKEIKFYIMQFEV